MPGGDCGSNPGFRARSGLSLAVLPDILRRIAADCGGLSIGGMGGTGSCAALDTGLMGEKNRPRKYETTLTRFCKRYTLLEFIKYPVSFESGINF